jgi:imidazolonepropionase-like amidohydrolase
MPPALFRAAIDESHRHGLRVAAHVFYHADAVELADAGVDSFAHLVRDRVMDDALITLVVKRNVYVMPNLGGAERNRHRTVPAWMDEPYLAGMLRDTVSSPVIARMRASFAARGALSAELATQGYAILERSLARLDAAGARIILGCDTGLPDHFFGYAEQKELELMAAAGMSPMNVIVAATSRAAEYLRVTDTGTLRQGRRADFLVLDANPLEDIRNTRRIAAIYVGGEKVDRAALRRSLLSVQ